MKVEYIKLQKNNFVSEFNTDAEFKKFFKKTDGTTEYARLSGSRIGLPIDIFVDDSNNYNLRHHTLWLYIEDIEYSHNFIPISISNNPKILIKNYQPKLNNKIIISIYNFIISNVSLLTLIADERIDAAEFVDIISDNREISLAESYTNFKDMATLSPKHTLLPCKLYIDVQKRQVQHNEYRLKYSISKNYDKSPEHFVPMSIGPNPEFLPPKRVNFYNSIADTSRKKEVQLFIKEHYKELQQVSDGVKDINDYQKELEEENKKKRKI